MKIAIDESPLVRGKKSSHAVRGIGYYLKNLKKELIAQFPNDDFVFFSQSQEIPPSSDIVHYPYFEPFFLSLPSRNRTSTLVTVHDLIPLIFPRHFPPGLRGKIKWQIQKRRLNKADRIITDSERSKKDIIKFTGISEDKIDVVYLAAAENFKVIKDTEILERVKNKFNLPSEFLLYVGDATWNKNLVRILQAVKKTRYPLVICGKVFTQEYTDQANSWNRDLVTVRNIIKNDKQFLPLGFVSDEDLPIIYNLSKIFVMPSLYEGFGLPVLEAMSCGLPVITSNEGSLPEVTGEDAAHLVDAYDENSICSGIKNLWDDKKTRESLSARGLKQSKKFSWKETASQTYASYEKAANS